MLEKIEDAINNGKGNLNELTSEFYTLIPHSFGRNRPPTLRDPEEIQKKKDMLNVLADIEVAQSLEGKKVDQAPSGKPSIIIFNRLLSSFAFLYFFSSFPLFLLS